MVQLEPRVETEEARVAVTTRIPVSLQERLRIFAFRTRRTKQMVIDDAILEYLDRNGG
jgi:predicted transcriptional regulator